MVPEGDTIRGGPNYWVASSLRYLGGHTTACSRFSDARVAGAGARTRYPFLTKTYPCRDTPPTQWLITHISMDNKDSDTPDDAVSLAMLDTDHVLDAIAHPRRRYLLYSLRAGGSRPLWELAKRIAAWEADVPPDSVREEGIERVYVSLYHNHVPKLVSDGIISFSESDETIASAANVAAVLDALDDIGGQADAKQEVHAGEGHSEGHS